MGRFQNRKIRQRPRDILVFGELSRTEFATRKHLAASCFTGSYEAAKKRLLSLIRAGFIAEKRSKTFGASVLKLTRKGIDLLRNEQKVSDPGNLFHRKPMLTGYRDHELGIRDVRSAFIAHLRTKSDFNLVEFQMSRSLTVFSANCDLHHKVETVRPDAFMLIREMTQAASSDHFFFLEIDRSTETQSHLCHLASLYLAHFRRGGFARKRGRMPLSRSECPLRVLMIFDSPVRLANTARKLIVETRVKTLVWLTTKEEIMSDPLGAIWLCPVDFRNADGIPKGRAIFERL